MTKVQTEGDNSHRRVAMREGVEPGGELEEDVGEVDVVTGTGDTVEAVEEIAWVGLIVVVVVVVEEEEEEAVGLKAGLQIAVSRVRTGRSQRNRQNLNGRTGGDTGEAETGEEVVIPGQEIERHLGIRAREGLVEPRTRRSHQTIPLLKLRANSLCGGQKQKYLQNVKGS
jgi:hypothetical protein